MFKVNRIFALSLLMFKSYLQYKKRAVNAYKIHSPFVFEFYNEIIKKVSSVDDKDIEAIRKKLIRTNKEIKITDLGQGSRKNNSQVRKVSELAKVQGISAKYGRLLARIVQHYQIQNCLELGTSLGIGSSYLANYAKEVYTIEGCENIQAEAKIALSHLNNIQFFLGSFEEHLEPILQKNDFGLVYIDGNHGYEPTLNYFEQILKVVKDDTFIVFDDINWSEGMQNAWKEICANQNIHVSLEFFRMGIVLKRPGQAKEHFVLKF